VHGQAIIFCAIKENSGIRELAVIVKETVPNS